MKLLVLSKVNTVIQGFYIVLVLASLNFGWQYSGVGNMTSIAVAMINSLSCLVYFHIGAVKAGKISEEGLMF